MGPHLVKDDRKFSGVRMFITGIWTSGHWFSIPCPPLLSWPGLPGLQCCRPPLPVPEFRHTGPLCSALVISPEPVICSPSVLLRITPDPPLVQAPVPPIRDAKSSRLEPVGRHRQRSVPSVQAMAIFLSLARACAAKPSSRDSDCWGGTQGPKTANR